MINHIKIGFPLRREDELLLCCARTQIDGNFKKKIINLTSHNLDWDYIIKKASINGLIPLLYSNLCYICPEKVPKDVLIKFKNYYNINIRKNLLLAGELTKILKLLDSKGINAIPFKGPVLAQYIYGNIGLRVFHDIDILINKSNAILAKKTLMSNDYELDLPVKIDDFLYLELDSEYRFFNVNKNVKAEINWNFEGIFFSFPTDPTFFFRNTKLFNFNGINMHIFSNDNHLLALCIHCAKHDWAKLSWICDISEFIKNEENINWIEVLEKSKKIGVYKIVLINMVLVKDLFQIDIPAEILKELYLDFDTTIITKIKRKLFLPTSSPKPSFNLFEKLIFDLQKRDKLIYGVKDVFNGLFKPSYADYQTFPLTKRLIYIYYILRPFLLLKRYF